MPLQNAYNKNNSANELKFCKKRLKYGNFISFSDCFYRIKKLVKLSFVTWNQTLMKMNVGKNFVLAFTFI